MNNAFQRIEPVFELNHGFPDGDTAIILSFNDSFLPYGSVMIQSIIQHASVQHTYDIIIIHSGISDKRIALLRGMADPYSNITIRSVNIKSFVDSYDLYTEIKGGRLTEETYYRLLTGEILSTKYNRAVYLDGDMVALTDIAELYSVDLSNCYLAATYDITGIAECYRPGNSRMAYRKDTLKLNDPDSYFIGGLLVFNLPMIRQDYPGNALMELAASRQWLQHDQDVLNYICNDGKARLLHASWNVLQDYGKNHYLPDSLKKQYLESESEPKIVHYGGTAKPWKKDVPRQEYFWKTAAQTPFFEEIVNTILQDEMHSSAEELSQLSAGIKDIQQNMAERYPLPACSRNQLLIELAGLFCEKPKEDPLVSVIIPVYNTKSFLRQCLDSVVNQTYKKLEIIIVDDGSTDGSGEICDQYAALDPRVKVIHQENKGVAVARNAGLRAATGSYIGWVDSDDYIACDMYEYLVDGAKKYGVPVTICGFVNDADSGLSGRMRSDDQMLTTRQALKRLFSFNIRNYQCDRLWKRSVYEGLAFHEGVVFEDTRLTYKLFERARWVVYLKYGKYYRRIRKESIVNKKDISNKLFACEALIDNYRDVMKRWPELDNTMLVEVYHAIQRARDTILQIPIEESSKNADRINAIIVFMRENREQALVALGFGPLGKMEYDFISKGNRVGFFLSKLIRKTITLRHKKMKSIKKELLQKKDIKGRVKLTARKVFPAYRSTLRVEEKLDSLQKQMKKTPANVEILFWMQNNREGESLEDTKRRVFLAMPKFGGMISLLQRGNFYLLCRLKRICETHQISFWILGGTALGAVRHKGFIPWDDDVDVGIMRDELDRLKEIISSYPDVRLERYYYSNGPWQTMKLTFSNPQLPFWIDLLEYDYAGNPSLSDEQVWDQIQATRETVIANLKKAKTKLFSEYRDDIIYDQHDAKLIDGIYNSGLALLPPVYQKDYIYRSIDSCCLSPKHIYPIEKIMPFCELEFEEELFPAPRDCEWYLRRRYGDYLAFPDDINHLHSRFTGNKLNDLGMVKRALLELEATGQDNKTKQEEFD